MLVTLSVEMDKSQVNARIKKLRLTEVIHLKPTH